MPAKDIYHDCVKTALIKDEWTITDDPLVLKVGKRNALVDLGAQKLIGAKRGQVQIAVEIKTFGAASPLSELEKAWGQFFLYSRILRIREPSRLLYLAVSLILFDSLFQEEAGQLLLAEPGFRLLIFNPTLEELVQWLPPISP